jgi:glyoxylase-like metal-dependent hydrolase (beta-lactamase superfamily II)
VKIYSKAMGVYQTNCYIVNIDNKELIIDPGVGATGWVIDIVKNPVAILNTHGHFDHVWSNRDLKEEFQIPIYCPKDDAFMLENDPFEQGTPKSKADIKVDGDKIFNINGIKVKYRHFAGHTAGNSVIEIGDVWFSGDFIFKGSIGRFDFPHSNKDEMIKSLQKAMKIDKDFKLYPGHGETTTLKREQIHFQDWIEYIKYS